MNSQILRNQISPFHLNLTDLGPAVKLTVFKLLQKDSIASTCQKSLFTPPCQHEHRVRLSLILIFQVPQEAKMEQQSHFLPKDIKKK